MIPLSGDIPVWATIALEFGKLIVAIVVAVVGVLPTLKDSQKKTEKSINSMKEEIKKDTAETNRKVDAVAKQLADHITEDEINRAKQARYRILRFYDEVCENKKHSESHFEDVLDDIDFYTDFCANHKDFKNSRGHMAMQFIKDTYHDLKIHGGFLSHE